MSRQNKQRIREELALGTPESVMALIGQMPPKSTVTPLISAIYSQDRVTRWNAISVLGRVMANIADQDMEHARSIMRRLIWSLNDESGGIGWGAPETMAEAMVHHQGLYDEYARILLSYIREDGNYLEYPPLRRGALWGLGRLGHARPGLLREINSRRWLLPCLDDADPESRGLAAWALGALGTRQDIPRLERLEGQEDRIAIFMDGEEKTISVGDAAENAIGEIRRQSGPDIKEAA